MTSNDPQPAAELVGQSSPPQRGRVVGIDYGTVRMGIALSDPDRTIASPYENYTRRGKTQDAKYFLNLTEEERVVLFVVGLPVHLDGRESEKSIEARAFGRWLGKVTGVDVVFYDERFSSTEAEHALMEADMTKKRRKKRLDMLAAQIILTAYLESDGKGTDDPGAIDD
ncbi:MAG: Holliday junction resolvase RuvX [Planctomycetota bacterium]|nr:Holliday junction resolvase RuvX [Planctomycetota bacterium]